MFDTSPPYQEWMVALHLNEQAPLVATVRGLSPVVEAEISRHTTWYSKDRMASGGGDEEDERSGREDEVRGWDGGANSVDRFIKSAVGLLSTQSQDLNGNT